MLLLILSILVALFITYSILSLLTSYLIEFIEELFRWRSHQLSRGLDFILDDVELRRRVLEHPLLRGFVRQVEADPLHPKIRFARGMAYIPAETFVLALFDAIVSLGQEKGGPSAYLDTYSPTSVPSLLMCLSRLPLNDTNYAVRSLLEISGDDIKKAREEVKKWFNAQMDTAAGMYRQRIQLATLIIAFVLTVGLGVDTFAIAAYLVNPPEALRLASFPLGWSGLPGTPGGWIQKLGGLLLTTFAVIVGTPFWFSLRQWVARVLSGTLPSVEAPLERLRKATPSDVQEVAASQIALLTVYHNMVLDQARRSFLWALVAAAIGLAFYLAAVAFVFSVALQYGAVISILAGSLVEVISGINFYLFARTSAQVAIFQSRLDQTQRFLLANSICERLEGDFKQKARSALVLAIASSSPATVATDSESKKDDKQ